MGHKKRGYNRDTPLEYVRDYKLFAIACEGEKTEPRYFNVFQYASAKVKVDVIENYVSDAEMQNKHAHKSAPKWVLDRAVKYIEKENLSDEDDLWFVIDTDRWSDAQIRELADYCADYSNWHIVISNPCFEVWLYFHKKADINASESITCQHLKSEIANFEKGGYHPYKFISNLQEAINNAKTADSSPNHYMPNFKETKVYELAEALLQEIGKNDFDAFIKTKLPELINIEIKKASISKKK